MVENKLNIENMGHCVSVFVLLFGVKYTQRKELRMEKKIDYDEVINRIGFFRTNSHLSARETSLMLGYSEQFMKRIENKSVELKMSTFLELLDIFEITPQDFFFLGEHYNKKDKDILDLFGSLSSENKQIVLDLMKKLK